MTLGLLFWILMLLWLIYSGWGFTQTPGAWPQLGGNLILFLLILSLGWQVFGAPIK